MGEFTAFQEFNYMKTISYINFADFENFSPLPLFYLALQQPNQ